MYIRRTADEWQKDGGRQMDGGWTADGGWMPDGRRTADGQRMDSGRTADGGWAQDGHYVMYIWGRTVRHRRIYCMYTFNYVLACTICYIVWLKPWIPLLS